MIWTLTGYYIYIYIYCNSIVLYKYKKRVRNNGEISYVNTSYDIVDKKTTSVDDYQFHAYAIILVW